MADIVISFRSVNELLDCYIFTKELSKVDFDSVVQVIFNFEHFDFDGTSSCEGCQSFQSRSRQQLITNHVHCEWMDVEEEEFRIPHEIKTIQSLFSPDILIIQEENLVLLCLNATQKCVLLMDAHLAAIVSKYLNKDRKFRKGFWKFVKKYFGFIYGPDCTKWTESCNHCGYLNIDYCIDIVSVWPKQKIDFAWFSRIHYLVRKRGELEENMAWLSTLGGGYSSLGDYFTYCALKAGKISKYQLKLAIQMSDPIMASKCRVFWAQSLLQQGHLKLARKIVWNEYQFAKHNGIKDTRLENMCHSVWNRLKHLYKHRHKSNKFLSIQNIQEKNGCRTRIL